MSNSEASQQFFYSDEFKTLLKSIVEESLLPLKNRIDQLERDFKEFKLPSKQVTRDNPTVPIESVPTRRFPTLEMYVDLAIRLSESAKESFVVSPRCFDWSMCSFFNCLDDDSLEKIGSILKNDSTLTHKYFQLLLSLAAEQNTENNSKRVTSKKKLENLVRDSTSSTNDIRFVNSTTLSYAIDIHHRNCMATGGTFHSTESSSCKMIFLRWGCVGNQFSESREYQMAQVSLSDGLFLNVIIPNKRFGLIGKTIRANTISYMYSHLRECSNLKISIPEFKIDSKMNVSSLLESLEIDSCFYETVKKSMNISTTESCSIEHRASFQLNETGVNVENKDWNGWSGGGKRRTLMQELFPEKEIIFTADQPFVFMIHRYGIVSYFGRFQ